MKRPQATIRTLMVAAAIVALICGLMATARIASYQITPETIEHGPRTAAIATDIVRTGTFYGLAFEPITASVVVSLGDAGLAAWWYRRRTLGKVGSDAGRERRIVKAPAGDWGGAEAD